MKFEDARAMVEGFDDTKDLLDEETSKMSDKDLAEKVKWDLFYDHRLSMRNSLIYYPRDEAGKPSKREKAINSDKFRYVDSFVEFMRTPKGFGDIDMSDCDYELKKHIAMREFLLRCLPKLNDAFELGLDIPNDEEMNG